MGGLTASDSLLYCDLGRYSYDYSLHLAFSYALMVSQDNDTSSFNEFGQLMREMLSDSHRHHKSTVLCNRERVLRICLVYLSIKTVCRGGTAWLGSVKIHDFVLS